MCTKQYIELWYKKYYILIFLCKGLTMHVFPRIFSLSNTVYMFREIYNDNADIFYMVYVLKLFKNSRPPLSIPSLTCDNILWFSENKDTYFYKTKENTLFFLFA